MLTCITHKERKGIITITYLDHADFERTMTVSKDELIFRVAEAYSLTNKKAIEVFGVYEDLIIKNHVEENHK